MWHTCYLMKGCTWVRMSTHMCVPVCRAEDDFWIAFSITYTPCIVSNETLDPFNEASLVNQISPGSPCFHVPSAETTNKPFCLPGKNATRDLKSSPQGTFLSHLPALHPPFSPIFSSRNVVCDNY